MTTTEAVDTAAKAEVYRRRNHQRLARVFNLGWTKQTADVYADVTENVDLQDHTAACEALLREWTGKAMPPPAEILRRANEHRDARAHRAAAGRQERLDRDRGVRRTEFDLDAPLCPRCGGGLMLLTDEKLVYCHACNGAVVQDPIAGRVKLTRAERDALRIARGPSGRYMPGAPVATTTGPGACNGAIIQNPDTGRTRLTYDEATRLAHGHVPSTMPPTHRDATPPTPPERRGS